MRHTLTSSSLKVSLFIWELREAALDSSIYEGKSTSQFSETLVVELEVEVHLYLQEFELHVNIIEAVLLGLAQPAVDLFECLNVLSCFEVDQCYSILYEEAHDYISNGHYLLYTL